MSKVKSPEVSYDTAVFGLADTKSSAEQFLESMEPHNWPKFSSFEVSIKNTELEDLQSELKYWKQKVLIACSLESDGQVKLSENKVSINECKQLLEKAHMKILWARNLCTEMDAKVKSEVTATQKGQSHFDADFKLEKIKPPTFSGSYAEWQSYSDLFKAAVIDNPKLSGGLKLVYLKNSLVGDAAHIAASFPPTNLSFTEAWELVEKRYNKKREIVFAHLQKLFSFGSVPDTSVGIRKLIDTINQCLRSLKLLNVEVDKWDVFVVFWAHRKLDQETRKQWLLDTDDELPELAKFLEFLEKRATALSIPSKAKSSESTAAHHTSTSGNTRNSCPKCSEHHKIYSCPKFAELSPHERSAFAKQSKLCINCLGVHPSKKCKSDKGCQKCEKPHHTLLHFEGKSAFTGTQSSKQESDSAASKNESTSSTSPQQTSQASQQAPSTQTSSHHTSFPFSCESVVLMATLVVRVSDSQGQLHPCRVFLDPGSEANFVTESLVDRLSLPRKKLCVKVTGIGGSTENTAKGIVEFNALSCFSIFTLEVKALILPKLTGYLPRESCKGDFPHLAGLSLADPQYNCPGSVDVLLGAEALAQIILPGLRRGPSGTPVAQNSKFGWFISGSAPKSFHTTSSFSVRVCHFTCSYDDACLDASLTRFWDLEDPSPLPNPLTSEDISCESHFLSTFTRDPEGRFQVNLPFSSNYGVLGESEKRAVSCFKSLEKQLEKDSKLKEAYHSQIQDYILKNWVEEISKSELHNFLPVKVNSVTGTELSLSPYYLPHHVVVKPDSSTTKFRIVFNASSKTSSGNSLNSLLLSGPKIQTDLHPLLTRFRSHPIALSADIVKFYHQVKVFPPHCDFQRFLWRKQPNQPFTHLRFLRVTFGVTSAPYLAIRALRQLGEANKEEFPLAHSSIQNDFLVDNLLSGATSLEEALEMKRQITEVLSQVKFPLQKWVSTHPEVISSVPESEREAFSLDIQDDESIKTIGLFWHPATDTFGVKIVPIVEATTTTKREILSHVARVFDPLQWLSPFTVTAKILLQRLWKEKVGWDDAVPAQFLKQWIKYSSELALLQKIRISRCITFTTFTEFSRTEHHLIGFCDASNLAYAACVYLRSKAKSCSSESSELKVSLIASKCKVAPVGGESTPRLELCSAVLLTQLVNSVATALLPTKIVISSVLCFTDSTGALGQLFSKEKQTVFVLNRVRKIKNSPILIHWYHVPGNLNPADAASRGISASNFLQNQLWLHGPPFLLTEELPPQPYDTSVASFSTTSQVGTSLVKDGLDHLITSNSSFFKMKRLLAYWIRFQNNLRSRKISKIGPLTTAELEAAQLSLVKHVQSESFPETIDFCANKKQIKGHIRFLSPFLDDNGILRVGGRLQKSDLTFSKCHPMLLPKCKYRPTTPMEKVTSHFVLCVTRDFHQANLHAGPKLLLSLIRAEFWIPRGQNLCSRIFRSCISCFKQNPTIQTQIMGQLPAPRVVLDFPFVKVGIDYAGPFEIAVTPGRKPRLIKSYVCVFVCMATKAVHLEYSGGLSTPDFISAFQRFCAIRNSPTDIFCDGGRNFLGAKNEMEAIQNLLSSPKHKEKVSFFFSGEKVNFHFSPPYGPHHGGLWEAAVKSMKLHLARVIQGHYISIEEFITLLARTSASLNSRPLTPLSNNPDDFEAITPFHFLSLRGPKFIPEEDVTSFKSHRSRWQLIQQMTQHLFRRWSTDYLQSLQHKQKWLEPQPNIEKGMMVLLQDVDSSFKHQTWTLGRIEDTFPGPDGRVRKCDVRIPIQDADPKKKVSFKIFRRPISRIAPLPIDDNVISAISTLKP